MRISSKVCIRTFVSIAAFIVVGKLQAQDLIEIRDVHGRSVNNGQIQLVDWEGFIANPAIEVFVEPTAQAGVPASVEVTVDSISITDERFYFSCDGVVQQQCNNSSIGQGGPEKTLFFNTRETQSFHISIRPDRDDEDDSATLSLEFDNVNQSDSVEIPIHVTDQDIFTRQNEFRIEMDYSRDEAGFDWFTRSRRVVARRAAEDWAYFIDDMDLDEVPAGGQRTMTWSHKRGFHGDDRTAHSNETAYTGFLLYPYGISCEADNHTCAPCPGGGSNCNPDGRIRSGGAPMADDLDQIQRSDGRALEPRLWRSGIVDLEIDGNYDRRGWADVIAGPRWFEINNQDVNDLYSIFRHEFGHALAFNHRYEGFTPCERLTSPAIRKYYGEGVPINCDDHFVDAIDPASLHGAFGNEFHGRIPPTRWLITKLDLLLLEAVGYELRDTTPMTELRITTESLPNARADATYEAMLRAEGGVPVYDWRLLSELPEGLNLDRITGRITGAPQESGSFNLEVEVCDASPLPAGRCFRRDLSLIVIEADSGDGGNGGGDGVGGCFQRCDDLRARCLDDLDVIPRQCIQAFERCLQTCNSQ